jgi:hypothetical protein
MAEVRDTGWQVLGEVAVETGRLALLDPGDDDLLADYWRRVEAGEELGLVHRLMGMPANVPVGAVISTGMGDGLYPIEGRIEDVDGVARIAEVRIRFLPHAVIGYDLGNATGGATHE